MVISHTRSQATRGFTLPEVLVVIGIIGIMIAIIVPALAGALRTTDMARSMSRMKDIAQWMRLYQGENREIIVPSQMDYDPEDDGTTLNNYPVKVRSHATLPVGQRYWATWADILWTQNGLGEAHGLIDTTAPGVVDFYYYDSPDKAIFEQNSDYDKSPFRSSAPNTRNLPGLMANNLPTPFGPGSEEYGLPGYFAANDFFDARWNAEDDSNGDGPPPIGRWYVTGQILKPDQSMYLVDSIAGETIAFAPIPAAYDSADTNNDGVPDTLQVDYRYNGVCLMLFLDGHVAPHQPWKDICDLEKNQRTRVRDLDRKLLTWPCP
jgi:prepilin-type N-terminal cleavage/methylation domain-containing protein/prepilin-type processing-associated H-X9-DG protein